MSLDGGSLSADRAPRPETVRDDPWIWAAVTRRSPEVRRRRTVSGDAASRSVDVRHRLPAFGCCPWTSSAACVSSWRQIPLVVAKIQPECSGTRRAFRVYISIVKKTRLHLASGV